MKNKSSIPSQQDNGGGGLYAAHEKIYPREVKGTFQTLRNVAIFVLLGLYYVIPWIPWDDRQAVLFDLPARKFYIFGLTFWPQDFYYLAWLLIIAALSLFFFTALAGRLWCGFACPQTVWTQVFVWMERWIEGSRQAQIKLDKSPWTYKKIGRKTLKQSLWIMFALFTGFTFVGYFTPITELAVKVMHWQLGPWETFWGIFYSFATYGNAGFLREQVCLYMCPYARFQSAMFDKDTLLIAYDKQRGEPRAKGKRSSMEQENVGDCIDCNLCVQVCPTGIDIRDGLQYECIACAACIDVCDQVMEKVNLPKNLIRYTTEHGDEGKKTRVFRLRTIIYLIILLSLVGGFLISVGSRTPVAMDILRDRNALYRVVNETTIENVYNLKVMNKSEKPQEYRLTAEGIRDIKIELMHDIITAEAGEVVNVPVRLQAKVSDINQMKQKITLTLTLVSDSSYSVTEKTLFFSPK